MSAGKFVSTKYQAQYGVGNAVHPIRVQPETLTLTLDSVANSAPTLPISSPVSARVSGGRRLLGLNAQLVRLNWIGAVPNGYDPVGTLTVPLLAPAIREKAIAGVEGVYLANPVRVTGTSPETVR